MNIAGSQNFTSPFLDGHNGMGGYRRGDSYFVNEPDQQVIAVRSSKKQSHIIKNPYDFNSESLTLMISNIVSVSEAFCLESKKIVEVLYHENPNNIKLLSDKDRILNKKPLTDLKYKIYDIYNERQDENWDGHGAKPLKFLSQSLKFAESLFYESSLLVEAVDVVPENDGCLCFEWYKSNEKFITVSVKNERLIYNYEIGGAKGLGETNFCGKKDLIAKINRVI